MVQSTDHEGKCNFIQIVSSEMMKSIVIKQYCKEKKEQWAVTKTKVLSKDNLGDLFSLMLVAVNKSFFPPPFFPLLHLFPAYLYSVQVLVLCLNSGLGVWYPSMGAVL